MFGKNFLKSKTILFNVFYLVGVLFVAFGYDVSQLDPEVLDIGEKLAIILPLVVNIALRFLTKEPVTLN